MKQLINYISESVKISTDIDKNDKEVLNNRMFEAKRCYENIKELNEEITEKLDYVIKYFQKHQYIININFNKLDFIIDKSKYVVSKFESDGKGNITVYSNSKKFPYTDLKNKDLCKILEYVTREEWILNND